MKVITLKQHRHAGKLKEVGDEYDHNSRMERNLYKILGWIAELPEVPPIQPKNTYLTAAVKAEPVKEKVKPESTAKNSKSTYKRRNMTAEK